MNRFWINLGVLIGWPLIGYGLAGLGKMLGCTATIDIQSAGCVGVAGILGKTGGFLLTTSVFLVVPLCVVLLPVLFFGKRLSTSLQLVIAGIIFPVLAGILFLVPVTKMAGAIMLAMSFFVVPFALGFAGFLALANRSSKPAPINP